jgi:CspA family cold shock protein
MKEATVKWFNGVKGYGFLIPHGDDSTAEIFVHFSAIQMDGYKTLEVGQTVEYEEKVTAKGLMAANVRVINSDGNN